ncbi:DNA polymerase I [Myxococcota bacterium]|nr:DNA polymerase I [Myxococcota bacterium]
MTRKRRFLLDGSALVYRAHFAFIKNPLLNSRGENTSAVFGYINILLSLLDRESPEEIAVIFDSAAPTFRHQLFPDYKATREKMPDEMAEQLPIIRYITTSLGIKVLHQSGVEADDIIGTLAVRGEAEGRDVLIVSGDKDFAQLVTEHIHIYDPGRGGKHGKDPERIAPPQVLEKYGVPPTEIVDYMALLGDHSDNVPGVKGIGEVTAKKLIAEYHDLDNLYAHLPQISASIRTKLHDQKDMAYLSRKLVTLQTDVAISTDTSNLSRGPVDAKELYRHFSDLEFHNLLKRIPQIAKSDAPLPTSIPQQSPQGQYHLIRDLDGLSDVIATCRHAGQLFFHPLFEYDEIRPHYFAFALSHGTQQAWIAIPQNFSPALSTPQAQPPHTTPDLFATSSQSPLSTEPPTTSQTNDLSDLPLFAVAFSPSPPTQRPNPPMTWAACLEALKPLLEDPNLPKYGHDLKESLLLFSEYGIQLRGLTLDTLIAAYLINPNRPNQELDSLALQILSYRKSDADEIRGTGRKRRTWGEVDHADIVRFLGEEIDLIGQLAPLLRIQLEAGPLFPLMQELENPLIAVLAAMERLGVALDLPLLKNLHDEMDGRLQQMMLDIQAYAEDPQLNVNSNQQIAQLLYEKLQIHTTLGIDLKKTKKGTAYSTDSETLEQLTDHPLPRLILDYRELQKLLSTYIDALPVLTRTDAQGVPRIHTRFRQAHTATGRLSSFSPNLQNIPTRTEQGRAIRNAFIAGPPQWRILSADYSQVELRLLAHISQDPVLTDAFHRGIDIHARTAGLIFDIDPSEVTPAQRSAAKAINFGIIYGMGPPRLAKEINVSIEDAAHFIKAYFASYPKVKAYLDDTIEYARKNGYVETLLGRKRAIHDLDSEDARTRAAARNIAVNTPIQGSAADLIKRAMIRIQQRLQQQSLSARMLLQIHDELLFEVPPDEIDPLSQLLREEMQQAMPLRVPLVVDIGHGPNWAEAH